MAYICNKDKGCIMLNRKKYFKGDKLPENYQPTKQMIDGGIVIPEKAKVVEPVEPVIEPKDVKDSKDSKDPKDSKKKSSKKGK